MRWRQAGSRRRAQRVQREAGRRGDVLTAGGEDEDLDRPNWFSQDLECASSKHTHTHINTHKQKSGVSDGGEVQRKTGRSSGGATQLVAERPGCQPVSQPRGERPPVASELRRAAPRHYPKMVKSISSNYIRRAEISCFYGNKCESFRTMACQVLNIAVRVMCHCQTDM